MFRMSENSKVYPIKYANAVLDESFMVSVRNTNVETDWADMKSYDRMYFYVELSKTFNASDHVLTVKLQQATSSAGAGVKDLTTSGAGSTNNYNSSNPLAGAQGRFVIVEARAADLDVDNNFRYVRGYVATTDNTGTDNVGGFLMTYNYANSQKQLQGAAATGSAIYVTPLSTN